MAVNSIPPMDISRPKSELNDGVFGYEGSRTLPKGKQIRKTPRERETRCFSGQVLECKISSKTW